MLVTRTVHGPMLVPPADAYVGQALIRLGDYAPAERLAWVPYLMDARVVLDLGANLGAHTLAFAVLAPEALVIAVEPQWPLYCALTGSLALTGAAVRVRAKWCALGDEPGALQVPFLDYLAPNNFGGLTLVEDYRAIPHETVRVERVDNWHLERCDFAKLDVEGAELGVLAGMAATVARCRPVLSVEADRAAQVPALIDWLLARDYRVYWHRPPLGPLWPGIVSHNLLAVPPERLQPEVGEDWIDEEVTS